ncbi:MAG: squalene/phytoene synthase family protein [Alphaproteobacteria bacterium]|nr:squalene/phytoene synthase family protein [Alphaproteobacteria bacterium]
MLVNEEETDAEYCASLTLRYDRERMLCVMLAPEKVRPALVALLAWNHEIAKVGEIVTDPMVGLIRYQWWRDALEEIYGKKSIRQHAVVQELAKAIEMHGLAQERFDTILTAREPDLETAPFRSQESLDAYALATGGGILMLWLDILGIRQQSAHDAAQHVGAAWALVGILRSIHHQAHLGRVLLPHVDVQELLQHGFNDDVANAVEIICDLAEEHIALARRMSVPPEAVSAMLLAVSAEDYLKRIRKAKYNPFDARVEKGRAIRALKLWWARFRGHY